MKVLVLSKRPFDMRLGDAVRFVNLALHLQPKHRFDLLCFVKEDQALSDEARRVFESVTILPFPNTPGRSVIRRAADAFSLRSLAPVSASMQAAVGIALQEGHYELLLSMGGSILRNLPRGARRIPIVTDSVDSAEVTIARELHHAPLRDWPRVLRRMWLYHLLSRSIRNTVDANVYASDLDASVFAKRFPGIRTEGIPNGVDADYFHPAATVPERKSIVFEGNMMFGPNVDAARFLCTEIVPRVLRSHPDLRVYLVGRDPEPEVLALASPYVVVTGTVPDVREYLWRSSVFVCPMRLGAGIKNKVLQAWATGMPVVATTEAMGGLDARDGHNVFLRDDPASFAETICWLLNEPSRGRAVAARGRELAIERFSWQAQADRFDQLFTEMRAKYE